MALNEQLFIIKTVVKCRNRAINVCVCVCVCVCVFMMFFIKDHHNPLPMLLEAAVENCPVC